MDIRQEVEYWLTASICDRRYKSPFQVMSRYLPLEAKLNKVLQLDVVFQLTIRSKHLVYYLVDVRRKKLLVVHIDICNA